MKIYMICNESLLEDFRYENKDNLEFIRMIRPLSIYGEELAKNLINNKIFEGDYKIYSSYYTSTISSAKYLSSKLETEVILDESFNDCKVGELGSKNMKMVKGIQNRDFSYKLVNGESLEDVKKRVVSKVNKLLLGEDDIIIFTHKRVILAYLLEYFNHDYNLDENIIIEKDGKVIFEDNEKTLEVYEFTYTNKKLTDVKIVS